MKIDLAELKRVLGSEPDQSTRNSAIKFGSSQKGMPNDTTLKQKKKRVDSSQQLANLRRNFN